MYKWNTERINVKMPACQKQLSTIEKVNFGYNIRNDSEKVTLTVFD